VLYPSEADAREPRESFVETFNDGRGPRRRPKIQEIERHASVWAPHMPADPRLRAAVAHLLGAKYRFTYQTVPGVRAALGLDQDAVKRAHRQLGGTPIEVVYQVQSSPAERVRWALVGVSGWIASGRAEPAARLVLPL
jgi:hypothetical protein